MYEDDLEPYLSDSGEMVITYQLKESNEYVTAPIISLIYKE